MVLSRDLLTVLRRLSRIEKLQVMQLLINELAAEEKIYFTPGAQYDVWSPYDAIGAASTLLNMLEQDNLQ